MVMYLVKPDSLTIAYTNGYNMLFEKRTQKRVDLYRMVKA